MLHKTRGIVLHYIRYRDTSIITKIYTERFGLQSYIVNGVRSKSAKSKIALFQPLTLLDMVVYHRENSINRISELHIGRPYQSLHTEIKKSSITLFLAELLQQLLHEEEENPELFAFIFDGLAYFDEQNQGYENFHVQFLLQLSRFLGLEISSHIDILKEVEEHETLPTQSEAVGQAIDHFLQSTWQESLVINNAQRRTILDIVLSFYRYQLGIKTDSKSLTIFRDVFS